MSRIIRVINNETIEISDYRNSGWLFDHNAPTIEDIRKQISNIDDWCVFKETINPFVLYGEKEELQQRIDKVLDFINTWKDNKTELKVSMLDLLQIEYILRGEDEERNNRNTIKKSNL